MLTSKDRAVLDVVKPQEQAMPVPQEGTTVYFDPSTVPMLNSVVAPLVQSVFELMLSEAKQNTVSVLKLTVYGYVSPEDGAEQLVITQFVDLPTAEALAYRRRLFKVFGAWAETLSLPRQSILLQNLVINVR